MAPKIVDLRIDATWVVPVEPAGVLTDHALIVDGGIIVDVVATTDTVRYAPRAQVSLPHHVLIPGLVNAHTHAAMTLLRGIADDVPLRPWLTDHIWPREGRFVSADFVYDNITAFDRSEKLPGGAVLEQSDATGWMGMFCLNLMHIALELARENQAY